MQDTERACTALLSERHMSSEKPEVLSSTERCIEDRLAELEAENSRLQRLVAELPLVGELSN
jgi:hypothetical protein